MKVGTHSTYENTRRILFFRKETKIYIRSKKLEGFIPGQQPWLNKTITLSGHEHGVSQSP